MKRCPTCQNTYPDDYQTCPRDQSMLADLTPEIVPGTVLRGKYEVISPIGSGGMAIVYKVRHKAFQEVAAIKVVHAQFMHDPDFIKRFRNEAIVARQLKHPNAVRIDDFDYTEDGRPFIVMEYVEGLSLYEIRHEHPGPWPVERCFNIVSQAAEALGAAHALGIVHRDIKPSNILLLLGANGAGQVKVLDFGIAKVGDRSFAGMTSVLTQQSLIIGTPEYMSPEQASGGAESAVDRRADLYSLGMVLYEMLTGTHPFKADTPMGMLIQQLNAAPPPLEACGAAIPQAVCALVLKTLQKNPNDRFQTAGELLAAMRDPEGWYSRQAQAFATSAPPVAPVAVAPPPAPVPAPSAPEPAATAVFSSAPTIPFTPVTTAPPMPPPQAPLPPATPPPMAPVPAAAPPPVASAPASPAAWPVNQPPQPRAKSSSSSGTKILVAVAIVLVVLAAAGVAVLKLRAPASTTTTPAANVTQQAASDPAPADASAASEGAAQAIDPAMQQKIDKLVASGNRYLASKDFDIATQFFEQAVALDKANAQAQAGLMVAQAGSSAR